MWLIDSDGLCPQSGDRPTGTYPDARGNVADILDIVSQRSYSSCQTFNALKFFYAFHSNPGPLKSLNPMRPDVSKWNYQPFSSIITTNWEMIQKINS